MEGDETQMLRAHLCRHVPGDPSHHAPGLRSKAVLWAGPPHGIAPGLRPHNMSRYPAAPGDKTGCRTHCVAGAKGSIRLRGNVERVSLMIDAVVLTDSTRCGMFLRQSMKVFPQRR